MAAQHLTFKKKQSNSKGGRFGIILLFLLQERIRGMLYTMIQKNCYMDSVELMVLSRKLGAFPEVEDATVMMGTAANLDIMRKGGFGSDELADARPNDMVIAVKTESREAADAVVAAVKDALKNSGGSAAKKDGKKEIRSWEAVKALDDSYQVCLISVPGEYAADEAKKALDLGMHVMLFSDNVTEEEERRLKEYGNEKGLLVMGPDCGTSILSGVPLAFANVIRRGSIGIAGAAGTGIQEVCAAIERFGGGISHAIGTGGRDLHESIGGLTMKNALSMLDHDPGTSVIVVVSKPPAEQVRNEFRRILAGLSKPCSVVFLGDRKKERDGSVVYTTTLTDAAREAVRMCGISADGAQEEALPPQKTFSGMPKILGLYSGGTIASEAAFLIREALPITDGQEKEGYLLASSRCDILDLGDDLYTKGRPHPMMDSYMRKQKLAELASETRQPLIVLMDVVLGYGAEKDPAGSLAEGIRQVSQEKEQAGEEIVFVMNLLGTKQDPQKVEEQKKKLEDAGAFVYEGNVKAVEAVLSLTGHSLPVMQWEEAEEISPAVLPTPSEVMQKLLEQAPGIVNVGLKGFATDLEKQRAEVIHFEWRPAAGGDRTLGRAIEFLKAYRFPDGRTMEEANQAVLDKITAGLPCLMDVVPACTVTDVFDHGKLLLHAGPPMKWEEMTHPMQGACVGALLFEEWASTEEEAWEMLNSGQVRFMPCHHADFVGPMGGITSPHMPVLKVKNMAGGNYAYCTMNEGIGQVLRFGAYSPAVIERLRFMRDILGPVLGQALRTLENGLNVNVMISRAIAMGDEFHQRNIAASLVFLKEMAPLIVRLDIPEKKKYQVIQFLADTDQFFLNIMMASAKSVMDYAATETEGTVVTVMTRNGREFGIRVSGMGKEWFTGPVNTPHGLYFTGFDESMANPDMGDSAITETFGVGGMAMIAAPAVTRFVGTGGFYDALEISNRMSEITISHNGMFSIPTWDFQGTCLGIDICKVVSTGITPVINTGIAHKTAGQGQIGAGTVNPPLECFSKALLAYAEKLGFKE